MSGQRDVHEGFSAQRVPSLIALERLREGRLSRSTKPAERPLGLSRGAGVECPADVFAGHGAPMMKFVRPPQPRNVTRSSPKPVSATTGRMSHKIKLDPLTGGKNLPVSGLIDDICFQWQFFARTGLRVCQAILERNGSTYPRNGSCPSLCLLYGSDR